MQKNEALKRFALTPVLYTGALIIIYASVLRVPYAFSDTYTAWADALKHNLWGIEHQMVAGGRPLYALLTALSFPNVGSLSSLAWLRLGSLLGMAVFAALYARHLVRNGMPKWVGWGIPLLTLCMPPFQVYAAWAVCWPYPWAVVLAGFAFLVLESKAANPWQILLACLFLTTATALYQPAAMMFWVFAAVAWLTPASAPSMRSVITIVIVAGIAMALDFLLAKTFPELLFGTTNQLTRTHLVSQPFAKLSWFLENPLLDAANLPSIVPSIAFASGIMAWAVPGLLLYWRGVAPKTLLAKVSLALLLLPLSYLPNLLVAENWASYRTQAALTSLILLYASMAMFGWLDLLRLRKITTGCVLIGIILVSFMAATTVTREFALPQKEEWLLVANAIKQAGPNQQSSAKASGHIYFRLASYHDSLAPVVRYGEFGLPSTSQPWVPTSMAWLMAHTDGIKAAQKVSPHPILSKRKEKRSQLPSNSCVIDLGRVLRGQQVNCSRG